MNLSLFFCTQFKGFKHCYVSLTIQLNIICLHTVKWSNSSISNNSILDKSFVCTQFYSTHREDPIRCYHSGSEWTWEWGQWRCTPNSPKLQHYWSVTIRLFNVISRTLIGCVRVLLLYKDTVSVFFSPRFILTESEVKRR